MKDLILQTAKILLLFLLAALLAGILRGSRKQVDFSILEGAVQGAENLSGMERGDAQLLRRLYGLNGGELKNWLLYTAKDSMAVEELLLVECISAEQAEQVSQAAQKRVEAQKNNFAGYAPEQEQLLADSLIQEEGVYVVFTVSEQAGQVKDAFLKELYPGFRR